MIPEHDTAALEAAYLAAVRLQLAAFGWDPESIDREIAALAVMLGGRQGCHRGPAIAQIMLAE